MTSGPEILHDISLVLDPEAVLRTLGGSPGHADSRTEEAIRAGRERARQLITTRAIFQPVAVDEIREGVITCEGRWQFRSAKLSGLLAGAERLFVVVSTIGTALEEEVSRLFDAGEYVDALVLDSIGSVAVGDVCQHVRSLICRQCEKTGQKVGPTLSPGYQYWDLTDQTILFQMVPAEKIGVSLSPSCLMVPRKSESMIVPVGRDLRVTAEEDEPPCRFCDRRECPARVA